MRLVSSALAPFVRIQPIHPRNKSLARKIAGLESNVLIDLLHNGIQINVMGSPDIAQPSGTVDQRALVSTVKALRVKFDAQRS
jgi:hypothetical protein